VLIDVDLIDIGFVMSSPVNQPLWVISASVDVEPALSVASLPGLTPGSVGDGVTMMIIGVGLGYCEIRHAPSKTDRQFVFQRNCGVNTGMNQPNIA